MRWPMLILWHVDINKWMLNTVGIAKENVSLLNIPALYNKVKDDILKGIKDVSYSATPNIYIVYIK